MTKRIMRAAVVATAMSGLIVAGCGDNSTKSSNGSGTTEITSSYDLVPDAQVTAGLNKTVAMAQALAQQATSKQPDSEYTAIHDLWASYEGTVKKKEVDTYLALEDGLVALKNAARAGDSTAATKAADELATQAKSYLAKHP